MQMLSANCAPLFFRAIVTDSVDATQKQPPSSKTCVFKQGESVSEAFEPGADFESAQRQ